MKRAPSNVSGVLTIARYDLVRLFHDRSAIFWTFLLPLAFAAFFGLVFAGSNDPSTAQASLTVVDEDGGALARRLVAGLESASLELTEIAPEERATAEKVRTLVIPAGFTERALAGETVTLRLEKEPGTNDQAALTAQTRIYGAIARLLADLVAAGQGAAGTPAGAIDAGAATPEDAAAAIGDLIGDVIGTGATEEDAGPPLATLEALAALEPAPDRVRLETGWAGETQRVPSGFRQSLPGNAVMFVMLVALTYGAGSITGERRGGTLRRLATAPLSRTQIVLGKILGRLAIAAVQITFFVLAALVAQGAFGLDVGEDIIGFWLLLLIYALAVAPLGVFYGALFEDPDQAANMGTLTTLVLAGLGGCWWPLEVVPETMQKIALLLPTGWAMKGLGQVVAFGHGIGAAALPILVLLLFGVLFTILASRFLRLA